MTIYPFTIHLGSLEITGFGLMMMFAFLAAGWIMRVDLKERGLNEHYSGDIVVAAVIGGIIGAKLWYVVLTRDPAALFTRGGLVWYGGFLGGVIAVLIDEARAVGGLQSRARQGIRIRRRAPPLCRRFCADGCERLNRGTRGTTRVRFGSKS
mgnify:CR=1 FL=1